MKYFWTWFLLTKIESYENRYPIFHIYFLNEDISVTNKEKVMKFSGDVLHVVSEGSVSQIFYLGPSLHFILCRNFLKKYQKLTVFLTLNHN